MPKVGRCACVYVVCNSAKKSWRDQGLW